MLVFVKALQKVFFFSVERSTPDSVSMA